VVRVPPVGHDDSVVWIDVKPHPPLPEHARHPQGLVPDLDPGTEFEAGLLTVLGELAPDHAPGACVSWVGPCLLLEQEVDIRGRHRVDHGAALCFAHGYRIKGACERYDTVGTGRPGDIVDLPFGERRGARTHRRGDDDGIADVGDHVVEHETDTVAEDAHRGDRDDADDDPGDREDRPEPVAADVPASEVEEGHASLPSTILTVRSAYSVIRGSWVTMTTVLPSSRLIPAM